MPANATTVLEHNKPHAHKDHATAKPAELWRDLMRNHTSDGDSVVDPFVGSGTTIIAAENLGRICYAMEISPAYVAVCLERFTTAFEGSQAILVEGVQKHAERGNLVAPVAEIIEGS